MTRSTKDDRRDAFVASAITAGRTEQSIGDQLGISKQRVHQIAVRALGKKPGKAVRREHNLRNNAMHTLVQLGWAQSEVARAFSVSQGRVAQIIGAMNSDSLHSLPKSEAA